MMNAKGTFLGLAIELLGDFYTLVYELTPFSRFHLYF
jgi:hypothetical protein